VTVLGSEKSNIEKFLYEPQKRLINKKGLYLMQYKFPERSVHYGEEF
jgi:hypothetical protein